MRKSDLLKHFSAMNGQCSGKSNNCILGGPAIVDERFVAAAISAKAALLGLLYVGQSVTEILRTNTPNFFLYFYYYVN